LRVAEAVEVLRVAAGGGLADSDIFVLFFLDVCIALMVAEGKLLLGRVRLIDDFFTGGGEMERSMGVSLVLPLAIFSDLMGGATVSFVFLTLGGNISSELSSSPLSFFDDGLAPPLDPRRKLSSSSLLLLSRL
jgi:hypothetical protein